MKNFLFPALGLIVLFAVQNFAHAASLGTFSCKALTSDSVLFVTVSPDTQGNAYLANASFIDHGNTFTDQGAFASFTEHGSKVAFAFSEYDLVIDEALAFGTATSGTITREIQGFEGGPGEAGWPASSTAYSCSRNP